MRRVDIAVRGLPARDADGATAELMQVLRERDRSIGVERRKPDGGTLDLGTVITAIVASEAVTVLAYAVATWIARHRGVEVELRTADREIILRNVDIETAERQIAQFLSS
jgi:hypothetical protein